MRRIIVSPAQDGKPSRMRFTMEANGDYKDYEGMFPKKKPEGMTIAYEWTSPTEFEIYWKDAKGTIVSAKDTPAPVAAPNDDLDSKTDAELKALSFLWKVPTAKMSTTDDMKVALRAAGYSPKGKPKP